MTHALIVVVLLSTVTIGAVNYFAVRDLLESPCRAESLSASIDAGRAAFGRMDPRSRKLVADGALRLEGEKETPWAALCQVAIGLAAYLDDESREARRALTKSLRMQACLDVEARRCATRLFSPVALGLRALIELEGGGYDNRADALISAAELQSPRNMGPTPGARIICLKSNADDGRLLNKRRRAIDRQVQLGRATRGSSADSLTEREIEVLRLLDSDRSRREIARELYLSFETVKTYVRRLYRKLGVSSRPAAVAMAKAWGWIDELNGLESEDLSGPTTVTVHFDVPSVPSQLPQLHWYLPSHETR